MPESRLLTEGSRRGLSARESVRAIQTDFPMPATADSEFLYTDLGGQIDAASPWSAVITIEGRVVYRNEDNP